MGVKQYLTPMLEAQIDQIPKQVMHSAFHCVSVFLLLSTAALLAIGVGAFDEEETQLLVRFIAANYTLFAVWQIAIAVTSQIRNGMFKMLQWTFFILIAILAWIGA
jgi:hypothetical protein